MEIILLYITQLMRKAFTKLHYRL